MKSLDFDWPSRGHPYDPGDIAELSEFLLGESSLTQGEQLKRFEAELSQYLCVDWTAGTSSCASALELVAMLADVADGDEVIIPAHTYCASAIPFARHGARLVWADIDPAALQPDLEEIQRKVTDRTRVVVLVHLYGLINPWVQEIADWCSSKEIILVEDCAQCLGASLDGKFAGTFGDFGCYSFHSQKNLTTLGEGGALITKHSDLRQKVLGLRHNGHEPYKNQEKYWLPAMSNVVAHDEKFWPCNYSLSEPQALIGRLALKRHESWNSRRRENAHLLKSLLDQNIFSFQLFPLCANSHVHHLFPVSVVSENKLNRDSLIEELFTNFGVKTVVQYLPLYRYSLFSEKGFEMNECKNTDYFFDNMLSIPFDANYSEAMIEELAGRINSAALRLWGSR